VPLGNSFLKFRTLLGRGAWAWGSKVVNNLLNLTVFLRVARLRSFSAAGREHGVATSVVTRRIDQLERALGTKLLVRSTRGLTLTPAAEHLMPRFVRMAAEFDELFRGAALDGECIEGHLRIKAPTTVTTEFLGALFTDFLQQHPGVTMDVRLVDHTVNPLEEGYDCCLGAMPVSYPNVVDVPLARYELVTCCSPEYLRSRTPPRHPNELVNHECLSTRLFLGSWLFESPSGSISVDVHSRIHVSDGRVMREAARRGLGIAALARYLAEEDLRNNHLVELLPDYPLATHWLKAMVPRMKISRPVVREFVEFLKLRLQTFGESVASGSADIEAGLQSATA
jgi:DNA-binding transcriptional LysR family regulator